MTAVKEVRAPRGFDVIGEVQGSHVALLGLLKQLGYRANFKHPAGRIPLFVGNFTLHGPSPASALWVVKEIVDRGLGHTVLGPRDRRLLKHLRGDRGDSFAIRYAEYQLRAHAMVDDAIEFLSTLPVGLIVDQRVVVTNAPLVSVLSLTGSEAAVVRACIYGIEGVVGWDSRMLNVHGGSAAVDTYTVGDTHVNLTGDVAFGGTLAAFRHPERAIHVQDGNGWDWRELKDHIKSLHPRLTSDTV